MSANTLEEGREKALKAGMNSFVSKPFHLDELVETILHVTAHRSILPGAPSAFNANDALNRLGGHQDIYLHALTAFTHDIPKLLKELPKTCTDCTDEQLKRTLHTLKGLSATVGADALTTVANNTYQKFKDKALNPKQWPKYYRLLNKIGLDARVSAQKMLDESTSKAKTTSLSLQKTSHLFKKLIPFLETNNLKALDLYAQLKQHIGTDEMLEKAIEQLDFKAAAQRCQLLMKQQKTKGRS